MAADRFALPVQPEESWNQRMTRICNETRETIVATRNVIQSSREALAAADKYAAWRL